MDSELQELIPGLLESILLILWAPAESERDRAQVARVAAKLRDLGIDPDEV